MVRFTTLGFVELLSILHRSFFFWKVLVNAMRKTKVKAGEWVIQQGARGDRFYIIDEGSFEVRVNKDKEVVLDAEDAGETDG